MVHTNSAVIILIELEVRTEVNRTCFSMHIDQTIQAKPVYHGHSSHHGFAYQAEVRTEVNRTCPSVRTDQASHGRSMNLMHSDIVGRDREIWRFCMVCKKAVVSARLTVACDHVSSRLSFDTPLQQSIVALQLSLAEPHEHYTRPASGCNMHLARLVSDQLGDQHSEAQLDAYHARLVVGHYWLCSPQEWY